MTSETSASAAQMSWRAAQLSLQRYNVLAVSVDRGNADAEAALEPLSAALLKHALDADALLAALTAESEALPPPAPPPPPVGVPPALRPTYASLDAALRLLRST